MPNLAIVTLWRDMEPFLPMFTRQIDTLDWDGGVRLYGTEGDSVDNTYPLLLEYAKTRPWTILKYDSHTRKFGSVQNPLRFQVLAKCGNMAIDAAMAEPWADAVAYIDADYRYHPDMFRRLWAHGKDVMAAYPIAHTERFGDFFYDTWGYSYMKRPFRQTLERPHIFCPTDRIHRLDTAGACMIFKAEILRKGARMTDEDAVRGLSKEAQKLGYELWGDPTTLIQHTYVWQLGGEQ